MNVIEALELADEWTKGQTFYEGQGGWRVAIGVLAEEVRDLQHILELITGIEPFDKERIDQTKVLDLFVNEE